MIYPGMERRPSELEEVTKAYVIDLEVVYAKTCLSNISSRRPCLASKGGFFCVVITRWPKHSEYVVVSAEKVPLQIYRSPSSVSSNHAEPKRKSVVCGGVNSFAEQVS